MTNKEAYQKFVDSNTISIYSQPWWMDAICGSENWDVWLYYRGENILAAMPYYMEKRGKFRYITKAPLTQTNGIIFSHAGNSKIQTRAAYEEKVIDAMVEWLKNSDFDVYEQQYPHTFNNWQPFFWNGFSCITRYSYLIKDTSDIDKIFEGYSSNLRKNIKKGQRRTKEIQTLDADLFYKEHEKIYKKQGRCCPFSYNLWLKLYTACQEHECGKALSVINHEGEISSLAYFVWDDRYVYFLMGGSIPELSEDNTFSYLMHMGIKMASEMGRAFDFEGSMIKRVAKAMREFGGVPTPYYRIRKIYNPDIIRMEAEQEIQRLERRK